MTITEKNYLITTMKNILDGIQLKQLIATIEKLSNMPNDEEIDYLETFLQAKKVEGCSKNTISYYSLIITKFEGGFDKPATEITTEEIRNYLLDYEDKNRSSKTTMDNIRRILSSYYNWLEDEDYIVKSPVRRIKKVKTKTIVKETISDEEIEKLRDNCKNIRDKTIINLLYSTGMRVSELINLNVNDINLQSRECIVLGKGNKQRIVYFDARTKLNIEEYLNTRNDNNSALFVSLGKNAHRIKKGTVEKSVKELGRATINKRIFPHKFRRTLATNAINKGMAIEQVQKLLGHARIDTTMHYAFVSQNNVKIAHRRYIC